MFGIEHGDQPCGFAIHRLHLVLQFDPVEASMLGIRIDADDRSFEPTFTLPILGIKEYLNSVTSVELIGRHEMIIREFDENRIAYRSNGFSRCKSCKAAKPTTQLDLCVFKILIVVFAEGLLF